MPREAFPIQTFDDAAGNPLSLGYLLIRLSKDARTPDDGQLGAQVVSRVDLDANGAITSGPTFWGNSAMSPADTVYLLSAFTAAGQQVLHDEPVTVIGTGAGGFGIAFGSSFGS